MTSSECLYRTQIKTRHQLNVGVNQSIMSTAVALVREGGISRLYRSTLFNLHSPPDSSGVVDKLSDDATDLAQGPSSRDCWDDA